MGRFSERHEPVADVDPHRPDELGAGNVEGVVGLGLPLGDPLAVEALHRGDEPARGVGQGGDDAIGASSVNGS